MNFMFIFFFSKANGIEFLSNKNRTFTNNIEPTLHFKDELHVALENIIFQIKLISFEKGDKNYGLELAASLTNKDEYTMMDITLHTPAKLYSW